MGDFNGNGHGNGHAGTTLVPADALTGNRVGGLLSRLPPQNLDAEAGVIGSALLYNDMIDAMSFLRPEDFYRDDHGTIWREILSLRAAGSPVDVVILVDALHARGLFSKTDGGLTEADRILSDALERTPHSGNGLVYAAIVKDKAVKRQAIDAAHEILTRGYSDADASDDLVRHAERLVGQIGLSGRDADAFSDPEFALRPWPEPPDPALYHGVAGDVLRALDPHTEADPVALLAQFLACFGNIVGRGPNWRAEATRHGANLFVCVVGATSNGRKGTSWDQVWNILKGCDPAWMDGEYGSGLVSGEGLIHAVRDPSYKREKVGGDPRLGGGGYREVEVDPGVGDKRFLAVENEFSSVLSVMNREGTVLGEVLRKSWDGLNLRSSSRNSPLKATHPHISIVAHITGDELRRKLTHTDSANGFANRFLWVCARRSKELPHGGKAHLIDWTPVRNRLQEAIDFAHSDPDLPDGLTFVRDAEANRIWEGVYSPLTSGKPGLLGAITSRAAPQVMRVALIYALLDCSIYIRPEHLLAGLAFWRRCEQSAAFIFGDTLGIPGAEKVLDALRVAGAGMTEAQIKREVFGGRQPVKVAGGLKELLAALYRGGLVTWEKCCPNGRTVVVWKAL